MQISPAFWARMPIVSLCLAVIAVWLGCSYFAFSDATLSALSSEGYVIENVTAYCLILAAGAGFYAAWRTRSGVWFLYGFFMVLAASRELDLHSAFTTMSILKSRFYLSPDVPLLQKLVGAGVIVAILYGAYRAIRLLPFTLKRLLSGDAVALTAYSAFGLLCTAKFIDSFARLLPPLASWHQTNRVFLVYIEENFEMLSAAAFLAACLLFLYGVVDVGLSRWEKGKAV